MRILSYNIYNCFAHSQAFETLAQQLEALYVHTVLLNEYRMDENGLQLRTALEAAGFTWFEAGMSANRRGNNANCNAIFSREPFEVVMNSEDFRFVAVRQAGMLLCAYHASPRGAEVVRNEVELVRNFTDRYEQVLLAGDLNSLAAADREALRYDEFTDGLERYMKDEALSFEAIDRLIEGGFKDLNVDRELFTVPTAIGRKAEAGQRLRLDYAFGKGSRASAKQALILRGKPFDQISDHYPVLIRPS